jgi:hypothetical protein
MVCDAVPIVLQRSTTDPDSFTLHVGIPALMRIQGMFSMFRIREAATQAPCLLASRTHWPSVTTVDQCRKGRFL